MADISYIRDGSRLSFKDQLKLTATLSMPAILAQLSSIIMQYIDAAMVGRLGANDSASIGLVSTSLWLFWGVCSSITTGFSVQVAHKVGAKDFDGAKNVLRQSFLACLSVAIVVTIIGVAIAPSLPYMLGGGEEIADRASAYFLIFILALPLLTLNFLAGGMLRCVGNMKVPSALNILMCVLDCVFNFFFIFPSHDITLGGMSFTLPGAGLGVIGAAVGTVLAEAVTAGLMLYYLLRRQPELSLRGTPGRFIPTRPIITKATVIALPMTIEHAVICGAQIAVTTIVAPLGVFAIAANSFAVTAESLCYMPGYGISEAATTLIGQSYGAKRYELMKKFGFITVGMGMVIMSVMGVLMYIFSPYVMALMSPVSEIQSLGTEILRIEAWAEPMFAASIVAYGVFVGVGQTVIPAIMNFSSIWLVRLPLAWLLARPLGIKGVWIAMCIELIFRGTIFLYKLLFTRWHTPTPSRR